MTSLSSNQVVIDAGIGWRLFTPHPDQAMLEQQLSLQRAAGVRLVASTLWRYEVTRILTMALYFKQLTLHEVEAANRLSGLFDIDLIPPDADLVTAALAWTVRLRARIPHRQLPCITTMTPRACRFQCASSMVT